jgi:WD40 repeat protein
MLIKLWDWDKKWQCTQVFEGHTHYVMHIVINPKDNNQFASASLDRTIKVRVHSLLVHCIQYMVDYLLEDQHPATCVMTFPCQMYMYFKDDMSYKCVFVFHRYGNLVLQHQTSLLKVTRR